jgi:hypothetical protein
MEMYYSSGMELATTVVESIYLGFVTLVPFLLIYKWTRPKVSPVSVPVLFDAVNTTLLIGAVPVLLFMLIAFGMRYYHGVPFTKFISGPTDFRVIFWASVFFLAVLPQMM